jgi:hypothetical protein
MVKLNSIGMFKTEKNDPTIKAHADIANGYLCTLDGSKTKAPVAGASDATQTDDLYIVLNTIVGDNRYDAETTIASGDYCNTFIVKQWENQKLIVTTDSITFETGINYASISAGTTKFVAGTDGKFNISTDTSYHGVYFDCVEKLQYNGDAIAVVVKLS